MKKIGILGGMGPEATADLYMKIVKYYQENFGAKYDSDFPPFIIFSVPIPDVVESMKNEKKVLEMLSEACVGLEREGCVFILIACNTVQYLLEELKKSVRTPIIGIAEVNAKYVKNKYKKVGIVGTKIMIEKKVYDKAFKEAGIELVKPDDGDQEKVTRVIMNQLAGKVTEEDKRLLVEMITNLNFRGAEAVLIACTDLPLVISQEDIKIPLVDCTKVYADEAARLSQNTKLFKQVFTNMNRCLKK